MAKQDILDIISPRQAMAILMQLVASDAEIRKRAREMAEKLLAEVDVDEVAEQVFWELDSIPVEDVWDNSGPKSNGYVDPGDYAWELFDKALEPSLEQLRRLQQLKLATPAKLQCMGILQGIHRFERESESEFKDWAADAPGEFFANKYKEWRKGTKSRKEHAEVKKFVQALSPDRDKLCE